MGDHYIIVNMESERKWFVGFKGNALTIVDTHLTCCYDYPCIYILFRSVSSAGEHYLDRVGVNGSNPLQIITENPCVAGVFYFNYFNFYLSQHVQSGTILMLYTKLKQEVVSFAEPPFLPL